ncbi:hypothetical protein [Aeromicrobium sp. Leaf350]|uniref:hypothetical protein n=1 Tax=Aeromicrobium sp. Leaf350 TaxID=2876565 RepID=UPI001E5A0261|nr:hypothetical protein [Aeromicrobium sp. Leaf350]
MLRQTVVAVAVLASAVAQSGCSPEEEQDTQGGDVVVQPQSGGDHLPAIPELPGAEGAVTDATFGECEADAGPQSVQAKLKNSTGHEVRYLVAVSWIDDEAEVLMRGVTEVDDVGSGRTVEVEVRAEVPAGASSCTFYVLRAPAA